MPTFKYYFAVFIAYLIWAAATPVIKLTLNYIPPFTFLFLRFLIVCVILLPFTIHEATKCKVSYKDFINIILLGLFAQSSLILLFVGLDYTTALDSVLIGVVGPLLSVVAGHYFFKDRLDNHVKIGTALAVIGTLVVTIEPLLIGNHNTVSPMLRVWGNILVIANNLAFLLYVIWSKISLGETTGLIKKTLHFIHLKPMSKVYPVQLTTFLSFYVGLASMIPFALVENLGYLGSTKGFDITNIPPTAIAGLLFMALFSSIVAYYLFEWSLTKITLSDTALFGYLLPIMTLPFAYVLLKELPTFYSLVGGSTILVGVIIAEQKAKKHL